MRKLYRRFGLALQGIVIAAGTLSFVALHPATTDYIAQKVLIPNGIRFQRVEGTLFTGFDLYGLRYEKALFARHAGVHYSLWRLLSPAPHLRDIELDDADIYPKKFGARASKKSDTKTSFVPPPVTLSRIDVRRCRIHADGEKVAFDFDGQDLYWFGENLSLDGFRARVRSAYADADLHGSLKKLRVEASGDVTLSRRYAELVSRYAALPSRLPIKLRADADEAALRTAIPRATLRDGNVSIEKVKISALYRIDEGYLDAHASFGLATSFADADVRADLILTPSLAYALKADADVTRSVHPLPSDRFRLDAAGDTTTMVADLYNGPFTLSAFTTDYDRFALRLHAKPHTPRYAYNLPRIFLHQTYTLDANATATLTPALHAEGVVLLEGNYSTSRSFVELTGDSVLIRSTLKPKKGNGGIWASLPDAFRHDIHAFLFLSPARKIVNIDAPQSYLTLFEKDRKIVGWATVGSLSMDANGTVSANDEIDLLFHTHIDSLYALMREFGIRSQTVVDAEIDSRFNVRIGESIRLGYRTRIPWYLIRPDSQSVYYGLDSSLEGELKGETIRIDRYDIGFMNRRFRQERVSTMHIEEPMRLVIDRLALFDTGEINGAVDLQKLAGELHFGARAMHYRGPEGNATLDADIDLSFSDSSVDAEGEVKLLDALITYLPKKSYTVTDDDIVIIQDIKEPSHTAKTLDIHIYSDKPLRYKIPMATVDFKPDVTIWKEAYKPTVLLGIVRITGGAIDVEEKHFAIMPSEVYFAGSYPPNPYLDIHILYELDFNRFNIYVSHTLSDPVFLFSSEPPMSQNDIMSYILFGTPADESFQGGGNPSNTVAAMLLGLGIKNAIGAATGIKFDTFNIINTDNGRFGVEIGKRIGKRFRIIYRNDTLSSFILQYTLSRSVRVEVDVKETGQGINILYVKDFRGPAALDRRW